MLLASLGIGESVGTVWYCSSVSALSGAVLAIQELGMRSCHGTSILTCPRARHLYRVRREFSVLFAKKSRKCSQFRAETGFLCDKPEFPTNSVLCWSSAWRIFFCILSCLIWRPSLNGRPRLIMCLHTRSWLLQAEDVSFSCQPGPVKCSVRVSLPVVCCDN
jgi:hypothetical protein